MRLSILAVGRLGPGPERTLLEGYLKRLPWPVGQREIVAPRGGDAARRTAEENRRLLDAVPADALVVALDARGEALSSEAFARRLAAWQADGIADAAFLIGGAEGLAPATLKRARLVLSFGPMTWPHLLARVMLAEQLYRAHSILSGHPYHRGGAA